MCKQERDGSTMTPPHSRSENCNYPNILLKLRFCPGPRLIAVGATGPTVNHATMPRSKRKCKCRKRMCDTCHQCTKCSCRCEDAPVEGACGHHMAACEVCGACPDVCVQLVTASAMVLGSDAARATRMKLDKSHDSLVPHRTKMCCSMLPMRCRSLPRTDSDLEGMGGAG